MNSTAQKISLAGAFHDLLFQRVVRYRERINFSSGDPIPNIFPAVREANIGALQNPSISTYTTGAGYKQEKRILIPFCEKQGLGSNLTPDNIVFGLGITHLYYIVLSVLAKHITINNSSKTPVILMSSPSYGLFTQQPEHIGFDIQTYPLCAEDGWQSNPDVVEKKVQEINATGTHYVALFYNINPHNPTGAVLSPEICEKLASVLKKNNIFSIDDLAYYGLNYGDEATPLARYAPGNSITLYSCSKAFGVPQLRAGFACGPEWLTREMNDLITMQMISLPLTTAPTIRACFSEEVWGSVGEFLTRNRNHYLFNYRLLAAYIQGIDSVDDVSGVEKDALRAAIQAAIANKRVSKHVLEHGSQRLRILNPSPDAGYFALIQIRGLDELFYGTTRLTHSFQFAAAAIDQAKTLILPLSCALAPHQRDSFRMTFGGMSHQRLLKGIQALEKTIQHLPTQPDLTTQERLRASGLAIDSRFEI